MDTMRAMVIKEFGSPSVFEEIIMKIPTPAHDEILLKVAAASFNPADASSRRGKFGKVISLEEPKILGLDVSGTVISTGNSAGKFKKGDRVYAYLDIRRHGSYAEYVTLKEEDAALIPENLSLTDAAAVPLVSLTAMQGVYELGQLADHESILINGATGGVGLMAIQLATLKNARITAVCSDESAHLLDPYPIDQIIDYKKEDILLTLDHKLDLFYNLAPLEDHQMKRLLGSLKDHGRFVSTLGVPRDLPIDKMSLKIISQQAKRGGEKLAVISDLISREQLTPIVTSIWSFEDIGKIHRLHEEGRLQGKVLIMISPEG